LFFVLWGIDPVELHAVAEECELAFGVVARVLFDEGYGLLERGFSFQVVEQFLVAYGKECGEFAARDFMAIFLPESLCFREQTFRHHFLNTQVDAPVELFAREVEGQSGEGDFGN